MTSAVRGMQRRWGGLVPAAMAAAVMYWAIFGIAQVGTPPLAPLFPTGALLYVEAKDFAGLRAQWDASAEKKAWMDSANYQAFLRSHLLLRLQTAQTEFASAAGVPTDYALVGSVAGANSALAMYKIGDLEFLYITRLPQARAIETVLWKARGTYQTRSAGGATYYVKLDKASQRVAAFAYAGEFLILATKEELIAGALELRARAGSPGMVSESWFRAATQAAAAGATDVRMVYNLEKLTRTPQFRSHWVQGNTRELAEFSAGVTDLEIARGEFRERRVLLRAAPSPDPTELEAAVGQLARLAPDDAGFYRVRVGVGPFSGEEAQAIEEKLFASATGGGPRTTRAPPAPTQPEPEPTGESEAERLSPEATGDVQNLEVRIDQPALADDRGAVAFRALREFLAAVDLEAMLEAGFARADPNQVFLRTEFVIAMQARKPWDAGAIEGALTSAADGLWSTGELGAEWSTVAGGVREMNGLMKLAVAVDGRLLILGTSAERVREVLARRNRPALPGALYAAEWRHARELPGFERMMTLIDFPQIRTPTGGVREPLFFSENLASLGRALVRINSASIAVHDDGALVRETVVYRLAP
jgi:hypothetical protein